MRDEPRSQVKSPPLPAGVGLAEVLPFLVGLDRTGRLSSVQDNAPPLEVFIERGRVVDAAWGRLRALSALEMGAVFLPHASFVFSEGQQSQTHTFELGPMDVAARLHEVAREGLALARSIPGPEAVPTRLEAPRQRPVRDPEAVRLLDQIDGRRSVAELVGGRQPLVVLRGLASLVEHGAIGFPPSATGLPPAEPAPPAAAAQRPADAALPRTVATSPAEAQRPAASAPSPPAEPAPPGPVPPPAEATPPGARAERRAEVGPPAGVAMSGAEGTRPADGRLSRGAEGQRPEMTRPVAVARADAVGGPPAEASNGPAAPDGQPPSATAARRGLLGMSPGRPISLLIVGVVLLVFAFAIVDSLQTLTPETPLPAAGRPAATVASAPTQPAAAPTSVQVATAAPTLAPQATTVPVVAQPATVAPTPVAQATTVPVVAEPATVAPTVAPQATPVPTFAQPVATPPAAATSAPVAVSAAPRTLLDEGFTTGAPGWPNAATSSAWWDSLGYHMEPRLAGQHVAIVAPGGAAFGDVAVTGLFHKSGGPAGGGYGLILRAQGGPLNGTNQGGRYYVFEVGDRGEVGAWRREEDRWVDLLPWTRSDAAFPGGASNRLDVRATGSQFAFNVNDTPVAQLTDDSLATGAVGVFTGGDGNQVVLERFTVTAP